MQELLDIASSAHIAAEIYHLKAAGESNWGKMDGIIDKVQSALKGGDRVAF